MQPSATLGEPEGLPLVEAVRWIEEALAGSAASAAAIIAVAAFGALMLAGRIDVGRGARIVLGCFIVFGAASIAAGLMQLARVTEPATPSSAETPGALIRAAPPPPPPTAAMTDPYAGASLPPKR